MPRIAWHTAEPDGAPNVEHPEDANERIPPASSSADGSDLLNMTMLSKRKQRQAPQPNENQAVAGKWVPTRIEHPAPSSRRGAASGGGGGGMASRRSPVCCGTRKGCFVVPGPGASRTVALPGTTKHPFLVADARRVSAVAWLPVSSAHFAQLAENLAKLIYSGVLFISWIPSDTETRVG